MIFFSNEDHLQTPTANLILFYLMLHLTLMQDYTNYNAKHRVLKQAGFSGVLTIIAIFVSGQRVTLKHGALPLALNPRTVRRKE
jgi:hypothetical protein